MGCAPSAVNATRVAHRADDDEAAAADDVDARSNEKTMPSPVTKTDADDGKNPPIVDGRTRENGGVLAGKGSFSDVMLGTMHVKQTPMSVLLLFARTDSQSDSLIRAAESAHYDVDVVRTPETALQIYLAKHHDVVFVDTRHGASNVDAEGFSRILRSTQNSEYTILVAVRQQTSKLKEDMSFLPLLKSGFNRQFVENINASVCLAELQSLEYGELRAQSKLKAAQALLTAVDCATDAIEITDESHHIQYVNGAFERMFGYKRDEVVGKNGREITRSEATKADMIESMNSHLRSGRMWDGAYHMRRKSGENVSVKCRVIPVFGNAGKIRHFVSLRNALSGESRSNSELSNGAPSFHGPLTMRQRKESVTRIPSMTFEAPITKVINMICNIRDESPATVAMALDNALDALRSSELYAPHIAQHFREDRVASDLVGGLMTMDDEKAVKKIVSAKRGSCSSDTPFLAAKLHTQMSLAQATPEIELLLESEPKWDFDIIMLERLTKKSPLVHLAMKTLQRFDVLEFLSVDDRMMVGWLQLVESNYHAANPYHNSTHAADVMHATAYFLGCDKIKGILNEIDEVSSLLAAVVHDLDHPGKTNSYLVNCGSQLALLYNDLAVLESHHVSLAFQLTTCNDNINIFKHLDRDNYRAVRQQMVDMVLATEMTKHFEHVNRFVSVINQAPQVDDDPEDVTGDAPDSPSAERRMSVSARLALPENRTLIKRMMIKCADVSNPARPLDLCIEWANRIAEEYCQQTDDEKARGLPVVMPVFDRSSCNVPKSQMSFIDFFINDMFEAWTNFCCLPDMLTNVKSNYAYWKSRELADMRRLELQPKPTS